MYNPLRLSVAEYKKKHSQGKSIPTERVGEAIMEVIGYYGKYRGGLPESVSRNALPSLVSQSLLSSVMEFAADGPIDNFPTAVWSRLARLSVVELATTLLAADLLDGDGDTCYPCRHFVNAPKEYIDEIVDKLYVENEFVPNTVGWSESAVDGVFPLNERVPFRATTRKAIDGLDFHNWVASKVLAVDPTFRYESKIGRGWQARVIRDAVREWVENSKCE